MKTTVFVLLCLGAMLPSLRAQNQIGIADFNHLALHVKDIKESAKFYGQTLGLASVPVPDNLKEIRAWFRLGEAYQIHLLAGRTETIVHDRNGSHFALFVHSIDATEQYLKAQGVPYHAQVRFDGVKQIYITDPDGYMLEFNERKK